MTTREDLKNRKLVPELFQQIQDLEIELVALKTDLRKFKKCTSSNGCFDRNGNLHVHNGEFISPTSVVEGRIYPRVAKEVWHKEGE